MLTEIKYTEINIPNIKKKSRSFQGHFLKRMKSKILNEGLRSNLIIFYNI